MNKKTQFVKSLYWLVWPVGTCYAEMSYLTWISPNWTEYSLSCHSPYARLKSAHFYYNKWQSNDCFVWIGLPSVVSVSYRCKLVHVQVPCVHFVFTVFTVFTLCSLCVHFVFTVFTLCSLCVHFVFTLCSLCVHFVFTLCSLCSLCSLCGSSSGLNTFWWIPDLDIALFHLNLSEPKCYIWWVKSRQPVHKQ